METFIAFLVAFPLTLFFVRQYLKGLSNKKAGASAAASHRVAAVKNAPCPRCEKPVPEGSAFCASCGAALSLWKVHRAEVQAGNGAPGEKGKPRPVINASLCIACGGCVDVCPETGTLELASGKAILAHPERCTGHAECVKACPTSAITLAFGNVLQTMRVPRINESFETNLPGVYIAGELGGMGLIKTAINEGKLAVDHVRRKLEAAGEWRPPEVSHDQEDRADEAAAAAPVVPESSDGTFDLLIAGAGPAGLSATLTAHQYGLKYVTIEQGEIASTIRNYPRHKFLMAEPVEMPLYGSLYISDSTKEGLLSVWETIVANTGVRVRTGEKIESIRKDNGVLVVQTAKRQYTAKNVVLALGKRGSPRRLGVPGEELGKVAYRLIEAETYQDKDILVVGGGDSAVEAALAVGKGGRNRVTLSYRGDDFSRIKERNRTLLREAEAAGRIHALRASQVTEIRPDSVSLTAGGQSREIANDYVFVLIGGESPDEFLQKTGIEIVEKAVTA
jgi:thioredoxin reductase (NADPH)